MLLLLLFVIMRQQSSFLFSDNGQMHLTTTMCRSLKSLAAVFNVEFSTLKEQGMDNVISESQSAEEILAFNQVRKLKGFYIHLAQYVLVVALLALINVLTTPNRWWVQWVIMSWGVGVFFHWLQISERFSLFGSKWEKDQVEKRLGRKL